MEASAETSVSSGVRADVGRLVESDGEPDRQIRAEAADIYRWTKNLLACQYDPQASDISLEIDYQPLEPLAEVRHILALPTAERPSAWRHLRAKLIDQREGMARMQARAMRIMMRSLTTRSGTSLEEMLHIAQYEHRVSRSGFQPEQMVDLLRVTSCSLQHDTLQRLLEEEAPSLRLSKDLVRTYEHFFWRMTSRCQRIHNLRQEYPDDIALFRACFARTPVGPVEVIQSPITLCFRCGDEDYAALYHRRLGNEQPSRQDIATAARSAGVFLGRQKVIPDAFTLERRSAGQSFVGRPVWIFLHEQQHTYKQCIHTSQTELGAHVLPVPPPATAPTGAHERCMRRCFRVVRMLLADEAKHEILAHLRGGTPLDVMFSLLMERGDEASYDFPKHIRERCGDLSARALSMLDEELEREYPFILTQAFNATMTLMQAGCDRDTLVELLMLEPLYKWPRFARRYACQKNAEGRAWKRAESAEPSYGEAGPFFETAAFLC